MLEWVNASYDPSSYEHTSTINPSVISMIINVKRFVRERSWENLCLLFTSQLIMSILIIKKLYRFQNRSRLHGDTTSSGE